MSTLQISIIIVVVILLIAIAVFTLLFVAYKNTFKVEILKYDVINNKVNIKKDDVFDGLKIAFFSDIHLGKLMKKKEAEEKIKLISSLDADIYLFGGDLIGDNIKKYYSLEDIEQLFKPLKSKKCYAIYGNHEFRKENNITLSEQIKYFKKMGFEILDNTSISFTMKNINIRIIGLMEGIYHEVIKDKIKGNNNLVLIHEGDYFDDIDGNYTMLSGHTHGGQLRLKYIPIYYKPKNGKKYLSGLYEKENKNLIVSKGIGCNLLKMRLNAKCDIILLNYK